MEAMDILETVLRFLDFCSTCEVSQVSFFLVCLNIEFLKCFFVPGMNLAIPAQICHVLVNLTAGRM